jgi:hypothetical protein
MQALSFLNRCCELGSLERLPFDASVLCFLLIKSRHARFVFDTCCIEFESTPLPEFFHITSQSLQGVLYRTPLDGVAHFYVKPDCSSSIKQALKDLSKPCLCRAGHFFLVRLRLGDYIECSCGSLLASIYSSFASTGKCPFTQEASLNFPLRQYFAIATADQRKRILDGFDCVSSEQ